MSGDKFKQIDYKGATIFELDTNVESQKVAFARFGGLVLSGPNEASIKEAMDTPLEIRWRMRAYTDLISRLPRERALTLYVNAAKANSIVSSLRVWARWVPLPRICTLTGAMEPSYLLVVDAGLKWMPPPRTISPNSPHDQKKMLKATGAKSKIADLFPDKTFAFFNG